MATGSEAARGVKGGAWNHITTGHGTVVEKEQSDHFSLHAGETVKVQAYAS